MNYKIGKIFLVLLFIVQGVFAQQDQQVVFVAGHLAGTNEIFIQNGLNAYMYVQGGISAVNSTETPATESNIVAGSFTGTGTSTIVVNGALYINTHATNGPGDVRNATNNKLAFDYTDAITTPSGSEVTGNLPTLSGTNIITAGWGGTVHLMDGLQLFSGNQNANSDIRFFNLSLEGNSQKNIEENGHATDNIDFVDIEIGSNAAESNLTGTLFLNGSVLNTRDNLAMVLNPQQDNLSTISGSAIARLASGSGSAGANNTFGMSLTSQNSVGSNNGYVTSTDNTRGRLGRASTGGDYLFPTADESGYYRPLGLIGAGTGTYFARTQEDPNTTVGTTTPSSILISFYNVVNSMPASLSGQYRLYSNLTEINNNTTPAQNCPTIEDALNVNLGTAQSESVAGNWGFQQGTPSGPAGTADLGYMTSVSYPTSPDAANCGTTGVRVAFKARPVSGNGTDIEEGYVLAQKPHFEDCLDESITCVTSLPVKLIDFTISVKSNNSFDLRWTTTNEENLSHYEVERSLDGINFNSIGSVTAEGNLSETSYSFNDSNVDKGILYYYRLNSVDFDLQQEYSNVLTAILNDSKMINIQNVYPNPANSFVKIQFDLLNDSDVQLEILDIVGRKLYSNNLYFINGVNNFNINVDQFSKGTYFVRLRSGNFVTSQKFTKH